MGKGVVEGTTGKNGSRGRCSQDVTHMLKSSFEVIVKLNKLHNFEKKTPQVKHNMFPIVEQILQCMVLCS